MKEVPAYLAGGYAMEIEIDSDSNRLLVFIFFGRDGIRVHLIDEDVIGLTKKKSDPFCTQNVKIYQKYIRNRTE